MSGFNFERDLPHQLAAVDAILSAFHEADANKDDNQLMALCSNPLITLSDGQMDKNISHLQLKQGIKKSIPVLNKSSRVLDVSMETGTGKTYTYTKAIFEINKTLGVTKFIVIVPTLPIKAGAINFLTASSCKSHFKDDYHKEMVVHIVESQQKKSGKKHIPNAISRFAEVPNNDHEIHVLLINSGMINSPSMTESYDQSLFDHYSKPVDILASVKPFIIVDEPHKFDTNNKTWKNIQLFKPQFIIRFGATFGNTEDSYHNLVHELTAVDAFNQDLVKGIVAYVEDFPSGQDVSIKLKSSTANEATFEIVQKTISEDGKEHKSTKDVKVGKGACLSLIHEEMKGITLEKVNTKIAVLSNGLEMSKGSVINPYSYSQTIQDKMIQQAVVRHFEIERDLLTRPVRIKPLTLFFIDNIEDYRGDHKITGELKKKFDALVKAQAELLLKTETNTFYRQYLQSTLDNIDLVSGGYFSKDNTDADEKVEQEVNEILHDKETLLSLNNPRRFIFSKWTLREGWDNPNVFQICKLRSSGSSTSKLQEVGRGLRLPVNEYMSRVKDEKFELHYHVDFTESDFVQTLVAEINSKSGISQQIPDRLTDELICQIVKAYSGKSQDEILTELDAANAIDRTNKFKEKGYSITKTTFPLAFNNGVNKEKVRTAGKAKEVATIRVSHYQKLKDLWEAINQKVILEYKVESEEQFEQLFEAFLLEHKSDFKPQGAITRKSRIVTANHDVFARNEIEDTPSLLPLVTMSYRDFLVELSKAISLNIKTIHNVFMKINTKIALDINQYLSHSSIRIIKDKFNKYLLDAAISKFTVGYCKVSNTIHPTKLTDVNGYPLPKIASQSIGNNVDESRTPSSQYLFDQLFYDSGLELENMVENIFSVTVFTKIPKYSLRIPVAGGGSYSPDFAYIYEDKKGNRTLNFIIETKDKEKRDLYKEEEQKIKHAKLLFDSFSMGLTIKFESQFKTQKIAEIISTSMP